MSPPSIRAVPEQVGPIVETKGRDNSATSFSAIERKELDALRNQMEAVRVAHLPVAETKWGLDSLGRFKKNSKPISRQRRMYSCSRAVRSVRCGREINGVSVISTFAFHATDYLSWIRADHDFSPQLRNSTSFPSDSGVVANHEEIRSQLSRSGKANLR